MSIFQEFLENSLNKKIKNLVPLTGGASADINRIIFEDNKEFIAVSYTNLTLPTILLV